ncbi:MAG: S-layer homology domain-containing protein, partial [Firmicutes bacterium]|nr:S-layer homology domain-containing protein [Bacillota bacterium]
AEAAISRWASKQIVKGYLDGSFKPDAPIKRAEFATIINRVFGFKAISQAEFSDVGGNEWFASEIKKAVAAGYMIGYPDGTFKPEKNISRQEAAVVLARVIGLEATGENLNFSDSGSIPSWSRRAVSAIAQKGMITGYPDGSFKPAGAITRAETVTVLDRYIAEIFTEEGSFGNAAEQTVISGSAVIQAKNIELHNFHIKGDLYIAESVGDGTVTLDGVVVDGNITVKGGGANSVILKNTKAITLHVDKEGVRIVVQDGSQIAEAYILTSSLIEQAGGQGIKTLFIEEILGEAGVVLSGSFANVSIRCEAGKIVLDGGHIDELNIESAAEDVIFEIGPGASVQNLVLNAPATVSGSGSIGTATVNVSGAVIEQQPAKVVLAENVTAKIGGKEVTGTTSSTPPTTPPSDDEPKIIPLKSVSVTGDAKVGSTLTAEVKPPAATVSYQWLRSDGRESTYNIIEGASGKTYELTAADAGKYIKARATGKGNYTGTVESEPLGPVEAIPNVISNVLRVSVDVSQ